jgi:hypothetical protein
MADLSDTGIQPLIKFHCKFYQCFFKLIRS